MSDASPEFAIGRQGLDYAHLAAALRGWFETHARDLPWREVEPDTGRRDPYRSLVSELMLQQTQVSRVLEKFEPFMARFPSVQDLAAADEQDVLAAWSGLGYYRRARLLHSAAQDIAKRFGGTVPSQTEELESIPGIGRYTAGAIASIVFDQPAPLVDGNVTRVLMRLRADERSPTERAVVKQNWIDAAALAEAAESPSLTNEGLMELGATVCSPRSPRCEACPLSSVCKARAKGSQDRIPIPKKASDRSRIYHTAVLVQDETGRILAERRPAGGLWASMWQAPTSESTNRQPGPASVLGRLALRARTRRTVEFTHITSHREVIFRVHQLVRPLPCDAMDRLAVPEGFAAISFRDMDNYPLANPHRRILSGGG